MDVAERLRRTRESRGLSIERLSTLTKIPVRALAAIERSQFDQLPGGLFTRGFLRSYAREVGLDPDEVVREYLAEVAPPEVAAQAPIGPQPGPHTPLHVERRNVLSLSGIVVTLAVLAGVIYLISNQTPPAPVEREPATGSAIASQMGTGPSRIIPTAGEDATDLHVEIAPTGACWAEARADGRRVLYKLMAAGERAALSAHRSLTLRLGDAGACALSIDGGPERPAGAAGEVRTLTITPGDSRRVLPSRER